MFQHIERICGMLVYCSLLYAIIKRHTTLTECDLAGLILETPYSITIRNDHLIY